MMKYLHHLFTDTLERCHLKQSWSTIIASLFLQQQIAMHHVYLLKPFRIKITCHWVAFHHLPLPQVTGMPKKKSPHLVFIINVIVEKKPHKLCPWQPVVLTWKMHFIGEFTPRTKHQGITYGLQHLAFKFLLRNTAITVMLWRRNWPRALCGKQLQYFRWTTCYFSPSPTLHYN